MQWGNLVWNSGKKCRDIQWLFAGYFTVRDIQIYYILMFWHFGLFRVWWLILQSWVMHNWTIFYLVFHSFVSIGGLLIICSFSLKAFGDSWNLELIPIGCLKFFRKHHKTFFEKCVMENYLFLHTKY